MKFSLKAQYGILFAVYLARAGKSTARTAALNLKLDSKKLLSAARKLVKAGVFAKTEGGFSLNGNPTALDVVNALDPDALYPLKNAGISHHAFETRALANYLKNLRGAIQPLLTQTIRGVNNDLLLEETYQLDKVDTTGVGN